MGSSSNCFGCVAQLVEQRSPKSPVGGSNPSALDCVEEGITQLESDKGNVLNTTMQAKIKKNLSKKKRDPLTFLSELKDELKKVSWTTKAELISATKVVVISTFCFGLGIYVVDLVIKGVLALIKTAVLFVG